MRIIRFTAGNVHGYLPFDVVFDPSLTFLTGINGSGKTTVVRSIVALLTPAIRTLSHLKYSDLNVEFEHDSEISFVHATRSETDITLTTSGAEGALTLPVFPPLRFETPSRYSEHEAEFYRELEVTQAKNPVFEFIRSLPTPMFLDLERRGEVTAPRRRSATFVAHRHLPRNVFNVTLEDSLATANELAEEAFRQNQAHQKELTDGLRQEIILNLFRTPSARPDRFAMPGKRYLSAMERNEALVTQTLRTLGLPAEQIEQRVVPFFANLRRVVSELPTERKLQQRLEKGTTEDFALVAEWLALQPREQQINEIVKLVDSYNERVAVTRQPITRYLESLNQFLHDSRKELGFQRPGNLRVRLPGNKVEDISALSSGERQLLVILTHLAFNPQAKQANVLIIDEPELSLHVKWQEMFVNAIFAVSPSLQVVLATHSPSIILDRVASCVELYPQYE